MLVSESGLVEKYLYQKRWYPLTLPLFFFKLEPDHSTNVALSINLKYHINDIQ